MENPIYFTTQVFWISRMTQDLLINKVTTQKEPFPFIYLQRKNILRDVITLNTTYGIKYLFRFSNSTIFVK